MTAQPVTSKYKEHKMTLELQKTNEDFPARCTTQPSCKTNNKQILAAVYGLVEQQVLMKEVWS